jgi:hypothetical protein
MIGSPKPTSYESPMPPAVNPLLSTHPFPSTRPRLGFISAWFCKKLFYEPTYLPTIKISRGMLAVNVLFGWRQLTAPWVVILLLISIVVAINTVKALYPAPQQSTTWDGVANPRHDPTALNPLSDEMEEVEGKGSPR